MSEYPWINRQLADEIHQQIMNQPDRVFVYLIQASAGIGKTYLARDIGTRLGSRTGYEMGRFSADVGEIVWSGILDLYDPDTNSNSRIEQRWIEAFATPTRFEFDTFFAQREVYVQMGQSGVVGYAVEKQRQATQDAFADGMQMAITKCYPVMAFDTVERLQSGWDATEHELQNTLEDTASVYRWLEYQIEHLSRGIILLFGRNVPRLEAAFRKAFEKANQTRSSQSQIVFEVKELDFLNSQEQHSFFAQREENPDLKKLLTLDLKQLLATRTKGNPLLLDIALQTLLETKHRETVITALKNSEGTDLSKVEDELLRAYMESGSPERQLLLHYLVVARNGLFDDLLRNLATTGDFSRLHNELTTMEQLPFIKWRDISVLPPGKDEREPRRVRRTYFFHDAMYTICERIRIVGLSEIQLWSKVIAEWYDWQIEKYIELSPVEIGARRPGTVADLLIESLPYRMRTDPQAGYRWYLEQSDRAIRSAETGLDVRLRDAMSQFVTSAYENWQTGELPVSQIDNEIIHLYLPSLIEDFRMDSALLWVKRFSVRGKNEEAVAIAQRTTWVHDIYSKNPHRYLPSYAEFRLWQGQALMYGRVSVEALGVFTSILKDIDQDYPSAKLRQLVAQTSPDEPIENIKRLCYVAGRCHNNMGYIYWMNTGQYWLAIGEFERAIPYFELVELVEERANSLDNIGRVYALLGFAWEAFTSIQEGLNLRQKQELSYREALSLNSLALYYLQFDKLSDAIETVDQALVIFRTVGIERGEALALTTRGLAFRIKAEAWRDQRITIDEALKDLETAEADLRAALRVFANTVEEPLRRVRVENELACLYRARYLLLREKEGFEREKQNTFVSGLRFFNSAGQLAEQFGFPIEKLDNLQDRAVLYERAADYPSALTDINEVRQAIPNDHKFINNQGLAVLSPETRVDAYFKLMGMVELLHGAVIYEQGLTVDDQKTTPPQDVILEMMEHYVLAIAYFNAVAGTVYTNRRTHDRIYRRLRQCEKSFLRDLRDREIPHWIENYQLPEEAVKTSMNEIFRLLLPFKPIG